jgi:hypothetical protein
MEESMIHCPSRQPRSIPKLFLKADHEFNYMVIKIRSKYLFADNREQGLTGFEFE